MSQASNTPKTPGISLRAVQRVSFEAPLGSTMRLYGTTADFAAVRGVTLDSYRSGVT